MAVSMIGPKFYAWDRNGKPLAFGKLYTYQARTNTPKPTYQSEDQQVENTNPVILNGEGYADVYLDGSYKMVLKDEKNNEIWSSDPVTSAKAEEWVNCLSAIYLSPTSFKITGNFTAEYDAGRKVRLDSNAVNYAYGTIFSSVYASGETTVVIEEAVVATGLTSVCASIVGSNSISKLSTVENIELMKVGDFNSGKTVITGSYHESNPGFGGAKYLVMTLSEYESITNRSPDEYGDITLDNGNVAKLDTGLSVNVEQFGAIADGVLPDGAKNPNPTDNFNSFKAACSYLRREIYPEYQGGKLEFRGGVSVCYATSGGIELPECKIIGNQCKIMPIGAPNYIFNLNLIHTTNTRRFTKNWLFEGFTMYTDRGFGVDFPSVDCDHFLKITGGWLIRSKIQNIDVDPGFACRSLVLWDLTHPDIVNVQEVGVPDGIVFDSISAQYAENTSFAISFYGDQLGTGSRIGSTTFKDVYNSITFPHDYTTRSQAFNDFGVLRVDNVRFSRAKIEELFGAQPIRMFNDSEFGNSYFRYLYVEFNSVKVSDFESILRGGKYVNCDFEYCNMYTENTKLSAPPRFFFTTFEQCRFGRFSAFVQSQLTNAPDANFINLGASSFGNTIESKPLISNQPDDPGMGWLLKRISAPADTQFKFLEPKTVARKVTQTISADGEYLLGVVPSDITEITALVKAKLAVHKITQVSADVALKFAGPGLGNTKTGPTATLTNASTLDAKLTGDFIGRSDQITDPSPTQFSVNAVYSFEATGESGTSPISGSDDLSIQFRSGDYEIYLVVSNLSGGDIEVANFELEYGQSNDYVNTI